MSGEMLDILYENILEEMTKKPVSYDALCRFAMTVLPPKVRYWCLIAGRNAPGHAEDLLQEIYVRLIVKSEICFFKKKEADGTVREKTRSEFTAWITRVALNYSLTFFRKINGKESYNLDIDDPDLPEIPAPEDNSEEREEVIRRLRTAFAIVISSDVNIYKVLSWLGMAVLMLDRDQTKIQANTAMVAQFGKKTLWEMYTEILSMGARIPWMQFTDAQDENIRRALAETSDNGVCFGDRMFSEFFMLNGGTPSGKKSVSDWENRINGRIKKEMQDPDKAKEKKEKKEKKKSEPKPAPVDDSEQPDEKTE